jgi:hypothetical protein
MPEVEDQFSLLQENTPQLGLKKKKKKKKREKKRDTIS